MTEQNVPTNPFGWWAHVVFKKYATFKGRASRTEFWSFYLITWAGTLAIGLALGFSLEDSLLERLESALRFQTLFFLPFIIPYAAVFVRRMHDVPSALSPEGTPTWVGLVAILAYFAGNLMGVGLGILIMAMAIGKSMEGPSAHGPQPVETLPESVHGNDGGNQDVDGTPLAEDTLPDSKSVA